MLMQVAVYSGLLIWLGQRLRWAGTRPEFLDLAAGFGLVCVMALFALIGTRLPYSKVNSGQKQIELPVDPIAISMTFLALIGVAFYEIMTKGTFVTPADFFLIAGTAILATIFREHPDRIIQVATSFLLLIGILMLAGYQYELHRPPHTPGVASERDLLFGGAWITLPCALGVWAATYVGTTSKLSVFGLAVVILFSFIATLILAAVAGIFAFTLCMLLPLVAAGFRLVNHLEMTAPLQAGG